MSNKDYNRRKYKRNSKFKRHSGYCAHSERGMILHGNIEHKQKSAGRRQYMKVLTNCEFNEIMYLSNKYLGHMNYSWSRLYDEEKEHKKQVESNYWQNKYDIDIEDESPNSSPFGNPYYKKIFKKILKKYYPETKEFLHREIICNHYYEIFTPYDIDLPVVSYILTHYQYFNIVCAQPDNGYLLAALDSQLRSNSCFYYSRIGGKKTNHILTKYYPLERNDMGHSINVDANINIEAVHFYDDVKKDCDWWKCQHEYPIKWDKYTRYALLMTEYDENILREYKGSFIILLDKSATIKNFNIMYRHKDFVVYQKGGQGVSFYKNCT